jgi:hypothetical protein
VPALTFTMPVAARRRVDFPAPLGPMSATMSLRSSRTVTPCRIRTEP